MPCDNELRKFIISLSPPSCALRLKIIFFCFSFGVYFKWQPKVCCLKNLSKIMRKHSRNIGERFSVWFVGSRIFFHFDSSLNCFGFSRQERWRLKQKQKLFLLEMSKAVGAQCLKLCNFFVFLSVCTTSNFNSRQTSKGFQFQQIELALTRSSCLAVWMVSFEVIWVFNTSFGQIKSGNICAVITFLPY